MEFLSDFARALGLGLANMAWIFIVLWGIERLWPVRSRVSTGSQLLSLQFWVFYAAAGALVAMGFRVLKSAYEWRPLIHVPFGSWMGATPFAWALYFLGPFVAILVYDFFNYWMHRAQHKWFWKQHSIHHSIEELSGVNSYFHWTEQIFRVAFISMPTALLFDVGIDGGTLFVSMLVAMQGNYIHSPVRLHFGWFRYVIADNRYHRIHHSVEVHHFDKNFATATPIWDILFGTAHFPAKEEWPATGVPDVREPATINDFLWRPFRQVRGYAEAGTVKPLSEA